jgi:hypothetical protein
MLSVYTRHAADCKHHRDKLWRRCNCPKWIWGSHNGAFVRMSAKTRFWDDAERLRHQMEFPETVKPEPEILPPTRPLPSAALMQARSQRLEHRRGTRARTAKGWIPPIDQITLRISGFRPPVIRLGGDSFG